jgi:2-phosphosulfolactate phosphatase
VIDVALTPAGLRRPDIAVVIDVLRATSTLTQALAAGYRQVLCVSSVERAAGLRGPGRVLAGERNCIEPPGFDQGNSPREAMQCRGTELVLATTNGAPAIVAATRHAPEVIAACLLNLDAVIELLVARGPGGRRVQIVCSGTWGEPALEDTYVAGRLSAALAGPRSDAALIAEAVAAAYATPLQALSASRGAAMLRDAGLGSDVEYCALESELGCVPTVLAAGDAGGDAPATLGPAGAVRAGTLTPAIR